MEAGISHISINTVRRVLKDRGYRYLQPRKKGLLKTKDCQIRLKFALRNLLEQSAGFWTNHNGMFLDRTSFVYKSNLHDQVRAPRSIVWRKRCEGLSLHRTLKGKKTGTGGNGRHFIQFWYSVM